MGQQLQARPEATFTLRIEAGNGPLATTSAFGGWRDCEDIGSVDDYLGRLLPVRRRLLESDVLKRSLLESQEAAPAA